MANAVATPVRAFKNSTASMMARVVGKDDAIITQATIASAQYTISELDPSCADSETPVDGHEDVALVVADIIFDTLQTDSRWNPKIDTTGYNFLHTPIVSVNEAFTVRDTKYLVKYELTPEAADEGVIDVQFVVTCV